jgi:hypothetical protein
MMTAMRFTHDLTYDAGPEEVAAMLADRAFREKVCEAMGSRRSSVEIDGTGAGEGLRVVVDQTRAATGIPSFARKLVGDDVRIVQRETWGSATAAGLVVEIPGKPGGLEGTVRLAPDGAGSVQTVSGDLKVTIPVVGGKLENLLADILRKALRTEERVGRAWLAGERD